MVNKLTGVLGATSLVGARILVALAGSGDDVIAFSRKIHPQTNSSIIWEQLQEAEMSPINLKSNRLIENWICAAPIWVLSQYLPMLEMRGAKRIVSISSTSVLTKQKSSEPDEMQIVSKLAEAELGLQSWCQARGIEWIILRPTLIYGYGKDKNIAEMIRFIRRFGFFPVFGEANGKRQPLHADDLAELCIVALQTCSSKNKLYTVAGGETLSYKEMILKIFSTLNRRPILLSVPLWVFRWAVMLVHIVPRYRHWSVSMAERMNQDLQFDCSEAMHDFNYRPRAFVLTAVDLGY